MVEGTHRQIDGYSDGEQTNTLQSQQVCTKPLGCDSDGFQLFPKPVKLLPNCSKHDEVVAIQFVHKHVKATKGVQSGMKASRPPHSTPPFRSPRQLCPVHEGPTLANSLLQDPTWDTLRHNTRFNLVVRCCMESLAIRVPVNASLGVEPSRSSWCLALQPSTHTDVDPATTEPAAIDPPAASFFCTGGAAVHAGNA